MLIKLGLDEIISQESLTYDILDARGKVIYHAGEYLKHKELKRKANEGLFRQHEKLPMEWSVQENLPNVAIENLSSILKSQTPLQDIERFEFSESENHSYIVRMHSFWNKIEEGTALDIALLEVCKNQLVADIIKKMDQLQYLNQLSIRDGVTYSHTLDVTALSIAIGIKLDLSSEDLKTLAMGALLHDLGKLFIPKSIMFKPGRLTDKEFEVMQLHPEIGYRIIIEKLKLSDDVARPALEHQELYSGGGYPQNLRGNEIHLFSQIVKIADVFDALTSKRPYKEAICSDNALRIMVLEGYKSFNPDILKSFLELANYSEKPLL